MAYLENYDTRQLRNVLGTFTTGVTVVTARDADGKLHGVTANSFSSVSLEPPLVLWSQALTSKSFAAFGEADHFTVNILADDQVALSNHFAKSADDKFSTIPYTEGLGGAPVLQGTVAHFECRKVAAYPAGDHVIYIGQVERVGHSGRRPLAFAHGKYMVSYAHELGPVSLHVGSAPVASPASVKLATEALEGIQKKIGNHTLSVAVWGNHGPTVVRWLPGADPVSESLRTGLVMSPTRTATGRTFAAFLRPEITKAFIEEDLRLTRVADEDDKEQRRRFDEEMEAARTAGVVTALGMAPSPLNNVTLNAYSAPLFNSHGDMVMALTLATPAASAQDDLPRLVLEAARSLIGELAREPMEPVVERSFRA